jgi:hypothetical protein
MPDLMTHTFIGLILAKGKENRSKIQQGYFLFVFFFLLGNILPDITSRVPMIVFPKLIPFFEPYHTLLGGLLFAYVFSLLFEENIRRPVFGFALAGSVFHQVTDLVQKNFFGSGYRLFFPLELEINIGFVWPEDSVYILPFLLLITFVLYRKNLRGLRK